MTNTLIQFAKQIFIVTILISIVAVSISGITEGYSLYNVFYKITGNYGQALFAAAVGVISIESISALLIYFTMFCLVRIFKDVSFIIPFLIAGAASLLFIQNVSIQISLEGIESYVDNKYNIEQEAKQITQTQQAATDRELQSLYTELQLLQNKYKSDSTAIEKQHLVKEIKINKHSSQKIQEYKDRAFVEQKDYTTSINREARKKRSQIQSNTDNKIVTLSNLYQDFNNAKNAIYTKRDSVTLALQQTANNKINDRVGAKQYAKDIITNSFYFSIICLSIAFFFNVLSKLKIAPTLADSVTDTTCNDKRNGKGNDKRNAKVKECKHCNKPFQSKRKNKIFCSDNCRIANHRNGYQSPSI